MHIGLIGGIGPAATDLYYRNLVRSSAARGIALEMTIAHADAPTLVSNFNTKDHDAQAAIYRRLTERLATAGAGCVAVTSIGGHFCIDAFKAVSPLPVIDMLDSVPRRLAELGHRRVGILGTNTVMETGMYGRLDAFEVVPPPPARLQEVHDAYLAVAIPGKCTPDQRALFFEMGRGMVADHGAEVVLLAGTDLFLAFDDHECGFDVLDCALMHVEDIVDAAAA